MQLSSRRQVGAAYTNEMQELISSGHTHEPQLFIRSVLRCPYK
jgi:predicted MPP superfamily phosphohydrolase